ncbi:MAG: virulence RhuM family protein [Proteobacteria bacterium]|nr:virulence RhuM family protein [Pseudomonadota bacterium]
MSKDLVTTDSPESGKGQFLVYEAEDGWVKIDVRLEDETVWLTQQLMADMFQATKQNIGQHLKNVFSEGELLEDSVVKKFFTTAADGKKYKTHWAITGMTAAEIIHERADGDKTNMGLTSWRGAKVRKQDVTIAKNYITEMELLALNNLVEQ